MCAAIVVAFAVMVAVECVLCNMPFWRSLAASGDSAAAYNMLGPGLERTDEGLLKVTDPTQAYMQVDADGSSEYVRMDPVSSKALDKAARQSEQVLRTVRVRPDVNQGRYGQFGVGVFAAFAVCACGGCRWFGVRADCRAEGFADSV